MRNPGCFCVEGHGVRFLNNAMFGWAGSLSASLLIFIAPLNDTSHFLPQVRSRTLIHQHYYLWRDTRAPESNECQNDTVPIGSLLMLRATD